MIQWRLDYIFISQNLQEYLQKSDVLNALISGYFAQHQNKINSIKAKAEACRTLKTL